eukprot:sb/3478571/
MIEATEYIRFGSVRFGDSVFFRWFGSVRWKLLTEPPNFCSKNGQELGFFSYHFSIISRKFLWISVSILPYEIFKQKKFGKVRFGSVTEIRFGSHWFDGT